MKHHHFKKSYFLIPTFFLLIFSSLFLYLDYKRNPITYIILSKKIELVSYLFFKDIPAFYPRYDSYSINYHNFDFDKGTDSHFSKGNGHFSILDIGSIYKTGIPHKLRKIFDDYAKLNPEKLADRKVVENIFGVHDSGERFSYLNVIFHDVTPYDDAMPKRIKEYIKIFGKKFIVTSIVQYKKDDEQCGKNSYDVNIIFDSNPTESMTMGLKNSGEICFIWDEKLRFSKYDIMDLKKKYKNYWF
ncbi:MAG: hypothetical protein V4612_02720 [Pseudomonadota bacterium]